MEIADNILNHYLRNCYFINGTACAGKSAMCSMLAEKYDMLHCEENYNMDTILSVVTPEQQPNLSYFHTKSSWREFVSRTPEEYDRWFMGTTEEVIGFEIAELIRLSGERKVIVDTNIPCAVLKQISDYRRVAIMLSPQWMSMEHFFDRDDAEKQFLLQELRQCPDPEGALQNFKACIEKINSQDRYVRFANSGFFTVKRTEDKRDTRLETLDILAKHFGLEEP